MKKIFCFLICFLTFSLGYSQTASELLEMAEQKLENEDYLGANVLIDKSIEKDSTVFWAYLIRAEIEFKRKNYRQVLPTVHKAIKIAPKHTEPYNRAGSYYNSFGLKDSALVMYNKAIALADNDTVLYSLYNNRGSVYSSKREYKAAIKDFELVLKHFPNQYYTISNAAIAYDYLGKKKEALEYLRRSASIDSNFVGAFINLGLYLTENGKYEEAKSNFDYAYKLAPNDPLLFSNRGFYHYKTGQYGQALQDLNRSINDYTSNAYAYRNRALVYLALNKNQEACRDLEAALYYGFTDLYGEEVLKLTKKHCKK